MGALHFIKICGIFLLCIRPWKITETDHVSGDVPPYRKSVTVVLALLEVKNVLVLI